MLAPAVFWPTALGCVFFVAGIITYRRDISTTSLRPGAGLLALGPVFIAAALAAFAGEHFTAAKALSGMVPKWLPARLFIAYFVGVAHTAAALSLVARRCIRWSTFFLAVMFALFVLLLHFPGAIRNPGMRIAWIVTVRETTFSLGAASILAVAIIDRRPNISRALATIARFWCACVIFFFGILHFVSPHLSPGVPDSQPTASWVPFPHLFAYLVGTLLIAFGIAMLVRKYAVSGSEYAGVLMLVLTIVLYVPQFFLARGVEEHVTAINFIFDTLLFSGTMLAISNGIFATQTAPEAMSQSTS